jgi:beta-lactamase regulating signal transducer with metallopeptidase domain
MSFDARFIVVALAAFAVANLASSAFTPWLWRRRSAMAAPVAAGDLRHLRLLPALVSTLSMTLAALSFVFFEPRRQETIGLVMLALALLAGVLLVASVVRLIRLVRASHHAARGWMAGAQPIALDGWSRPAFAITATFPIVAVVGVWRPRLLVARSVLAACTADQLRAVVAHERGHADRGDNTGRLLLAVTPDVWSWLPSSRQFAATWHEAAEDAADDCAASLGDRGRLWLAEALIRVARLTPTGLTSPAVLPASALYRGENIERRVRRLVNPATAPSRTPVSPWRRFLTRAALVVGCVLALKAVYEVLEAAVTFLP